MIKRIAIIILSLFILVIIGIGLVIYNKFSITPVDRPWNLSGKEETIEVSYIRWACDCPNWIETKYYKKNPEYEAKAEDCIFIEAANPDSAIPEDFDEHKYRLKLKGQFYIDQGISKDYSLKTPEKPQRAKVFRYESYELLKR